MQEFKPNNTITLAFDLTQHKRDEELIINLLAFFGSGYIYESKPNKPDSDSAIHIKIQRFDFIIENFLPFWEAYPILGSKYEDCID